MASHICPVGLQGAPPTWCRLTLVAIPACQSVTKGPVWLSNSTFFVNGPSSCWQDFFLQEVQRWRASCILNHPCSVGTFILGAREVSVLSSGEAKVQRSWVILLRSPWKPQLTLLRCDEEPNPRRKTNIPWLAMRPTGDTLMGLSWALLLLCQIFPLPLV